MQRLNSVLLVDDDPATNFYHSYVLQESNIVQKINEANNGKEALSYLLNVEKQSKPTGCDALPSIIFLDLNMPVMSGFDFLDAYQAWDYPPKSEIKICILTSSYHERDQKKASTYPFVSEYLTKPLTGEELQRLVTKHFA